MMQNFNALRFAVYDIIVQIDNFTSRLFSL